MTTLQELAAEFISIYFKNPSEEVIKAVENEFIPIFDLFNKIQKIRDECRGKGDDYEFEHDDEDNGNIEKTINKLASIFIKDLQEDYSLFKNQTAENPVNRRYTESDYLDAQTKNRLVFQMKNVIVELIEDLTD